MSQYADLKVYHTGSDTARHDASRRRALLRGMAVLRRRRFHAGIFHLHCIALRRREATRRTMSCLAVPDPV